MRALLPSNTTVPDGVALLNDATAVAALPAFLPAAIDLGGVDVLSLVLSIILLVICLGVHEAAHAWVAWRCGDSTAKDLGRLTLNPIAHVDPWMTILFPAMLFFVTNGAMIFGGARPVPVDFHRLRHPWRDMSLVALAGPASNLLLAILFAIVFSLAIRYGFYNDAAETMNARMHDRLPSILFTAVNFNLLLAVFNMVPIPPLDGSRVMAWLMPASLRPSYLSLERFGLMLVLALFFVPGFQPMLGRSIAFFRNLIFQAVF